MPTKFTATAFSTLALSASAAIGIVTYAETQVTEYLQKRMMDMVWLRFSSCCVVNFCVACQGWSFVNACDFLRYCRIIFVINLLTYDPMGVGSTFKECDQLAHFFHSESERTRSRSSVHVEIPWSGERGANISPQRWWLVHFNMQLQCRALRRWLPNVMDSWHDSVAALVNIGHLCFHLCDRAISCT